MRQAVHSVLLLALALPAVGARGSEGESVAAEQVRQADAELQTVLITKPDAAAAGRLIADDYVRTNSDGRVQNKAAFLGNVRPERARQPSKRDDLRVRAYGDTAVVTGRYILVQLDGKETEPRRFTDVWTRTGGRWQLNTSHITIIEGPKPRPSP